MESNRARRPGLIGFLSTSGLDAPLGHRPALHGLIGGLDLPPRPILAALEPSKPPVSRDIARLHWMDNARGLLFDHQRALGLLMEIVEKQVTTGFLRLHLDQEFGFRLDDDLELKGQTLELDRSGIQILDLQDNRAAGRSLGFGRFELVVLYRQINRLAIVGTRSR